MYVVEVPFDGINAAINGRGNAALWHQRLGHMSEKGMKILASKGFRIPEEEWQRKEVSLAHLKVFGCDSYVKVKDVARDKLDAKSMMCTFIGYGSDEMGYHFWDSKGHKVDQVVLEDSPENLTNKSMVAKHGLSSEFTQSPGGSSYTSEESKNSGSFKDNGRSYEEDSKDGAFFEEGGYETPRITSMKEGITEQVKSRMAAKGSAKQILGMSIIRDKTKSTVRLSQEKYIGNVLKKFNTKDAEARCQPLGDHFKLSKKQAPKTEASKQRMAKITYASAVGSVMYAMVCTRPDIAHTVGVVSRFMSNLGREHYEAVKARIECVLFYDNHSVIHLAKNTVFHGRTKHIKIRYHYIQELVSEGTLSLKKILGAKNSADMLTKVVTTKKLKLCATSTGLRDN
uniref:Retrovirus-related Pol polyprotein from transposon TNT 1-94 n=1 Tax=Tanacetum cinerariifolium TaxID=118510 RepID=A0A6L2N0S2_TANCI|nr:retrovirus-related Pol polyprotein from transposon TNT 1-94 [Tanacetum cinerariifolium]